MEREGRGVKRRARTEDGEREGGGGDKRAEEGERELRKRMYITHEV